MDLSDNEKLIKCSKYFRDKISRIYVGNVKKAFLLDDVTSKSPAQGRQKQEEIAWRSCLMQGWYLRCSWIKKIDFLKQLAKRTNSHRTLILVLNTIYSGTCKDWIYSSYQGLNLYKNDIKLNDDNRSLDTHNLEKVINNELKWFESLCDFAQFQRIMEMIYLGDGAVLGKVYAEFETILKDKLRFEVNQSFIDLDTYSTNQTENKLKPARSEDLEEVLLLLYDYVENITKNSETTKLENAMKKWDTFMLTYLKKLGLDKSAFSKEKVKPRKQKIKKGGPTKKAKVKDTTNKNLPDKIQLLPVWINKQIVAQLDPKLYKNMKKVNKYWNYMIRSVTQDTKCRIDLNKTMAKLKESIPEFAEVKPNRATPILCKKFTNISYVCDAAIRRNLIHNVTNATTLISDLYAYCRDLNLCSTKLLSFPRRFYVPNTTSFRSLITFSERIF